MKKTICFLLFVVGVTACKNKYRPPFKTGYEGKSLPAFNILLPDSSTLFNTANIPKGTPLVLMYFLPNCPYSQGEMKNIINNISNFRNIRFFICTSQPLEQLKGFYTYFNLDKYPNITAGVDFKHFVPDYFKPMAVPFTMIYNKNQQLTKAFVGTLPSKQIEDEIAKFDRVK